MRHHVRTRLLLLAALLYMGLMAAVVRPVVAAEYASGVATDVTGTLATTEAGEAAQRDGLEGEGLPDDAIGQQVEEEGILEGNTRGQQSVVQRRARKFSVLSKIRENPQAVAAIAAVVGLANLVLWGLWWLLSGARGASAGRGVTGTGPMPLRVQALLAVIHAALPVLIGLLYVLLYQRALDSADVMDPDVVQGAVAAASAQS